MISLISLVFFLFPITLVHADTYPLNEPGEYTPNISVEVSEEPSYDNNPTDYFISVPIDPQYDYSLEGIMGNSPLTLESFVRDRNGGQFNNYDEFLVYLKNRAPELFERPVFLHHTGSLQYATFEEPRVLLFGRGAVLAFERSPNQEGVGRVEMIEFNPDEGRFQPGEISFFGKHNIKMESEPKKCSSCHGKNPNPIWAPYSAWPKAFRSNGGFFWESEIEQEYYRNFRDRKNKVGIYKYVKAEAPENHDNSILEYTQFLSVLNNMRMMSILRQNNHLIKPFRYTLAAILNGCTNETRKKPKKDRTYQLEEFLPPHISTLLTIPIEHFKEDGRKAREKFVAYLQEFHKNIFGTDRTDIPVLTDNFIREENLLTELRYILENLGLPWRDLAMGHGENDYIVQTAAVTQFDLMNTFITYDRSIFVELKPSFMLIYVVGDLSRYAAFPCEDLKTRSLEELQGVRSIDAIPLFISHTDPSADLAPMSRCIKCHVTENTASYIPFDDSMALRRWLNVPSNRELTTSLIRNGKMPRKSSLTQEEKEAFIKVIEALDLK